MASTITVPDRQIVGHNVQQICNQLSDVAAAAKADIEALQAVTTSGDIKGSVVLATTAALAANTRTGNVLLADANGLLGSIDGVDTATLTLPFRLLVKNEVTQANNGIYDVTSIGGAGSKWSMTRSSDADESAEVTPDMLVGVERGSANGDKIFQLDIDGPVTLNTTALVFADFRGLAITAPANVTKAAAAVGVSLTVARSDHKHDIDTAVAGTIAIGDVAAEGVATSMARSDHVHAVPAPAAPADVTKAAADAGAATTFARADHKHDVSTAAAVSVALANAEGSASSLARSDHTHNSGNQTFELTLDGVGGTAAKTTGIVVTASTRAMITLKTPGAGVSGTRYAVAYVVGGAGVGSVTVTAKDSAAGNNTVNTDNSLLEVTLVEAAVIA